MRYWKRMRKGIFSFGFNRLGKKGTFLIQSSKYGYQYDVAKRVMDDLIEAKGVKNMAIPMLKMTNATRRVAYAKPSKAIIGLEKKAYEICTSFGKDSLNALAALLAHELTHYYEKHEWKDQFSNDFGSTSSTGNAAAEKLDAETQADYLGGFLAYTAGYNTLGVMPRFLQKVYDTYFPNSNGILPGYPSLSQRIEMAEKSLEKLENLIPVFEAANYLVVLKDYRNAKAYYDHILVKENYQSREIYNNLGVTATQLAMDLFSEGDLKYVYPVELDVQSRLQPKTKGMGDDPEERRKLILNEALKYFENAKVLDPDYATAYLNLGCVYALQGKFFDAEYHARKTLELAGDQGNEKLISDANVLIGIIKARQNQKEAAASFFDQSRQVNNPLGELNWTILKGESLPTPTGIGLALAKSESIENVDMDGVVNELYLGGLNPTRQVKINRKVIFALVEKSTSTIYINFEPSADAYHLFHQTNANYVGKTNKGIQLGDDQTQVTDTLAYGTPTAILNTSTGKILHYANYKLLFAINQKGKVTQWVVYRQSGED